MSLIHWWPLNGNTNDLGLNPTSLTNNGATVNSAGKIGSCYYLSASSGFVGAFNTNALMHGACSFSLWIKIPETEYKARVSDFTYDSDHILMNSRVFGTNNSYTNTGLCLALQTNNIYSSGSVSSISLYMGWRDSNSAPIFEPYTIAFNTWYHVVITKDVSGKMIMYINGLKVKGPLQASANAFAESNFYINTGAVWGSGNYRNSNAPMYLNDFRIYDHALSVKEVKEISKGLVLHYNFEDEYIEPTTNLFGGRTDFSNTNHWSRSQINATAPTIDTDCNMVLYGAGTDGNHQSYTVSSNGGYITISPSTTYTLSVYVKYSSTNAYFNMYFYERTDSAAVKTNVQRLGCTADEVGKWVLRKLTVTTQSTTTKMYTELNCYKCLATETIVMKNNTVQLEAKDHATPYVNGTRSTGKVYDNSGYGNNGTVNGNLQISSDSMSGQYSALFTTDNTWIATNYSTGGLNTLTYSAWVCPTARTSDRSCISIGGTYFTIDDGGHLSGYAYGTSPAGYHTGSGIIPLNTWTHIALIWTGSHIIGYINGQEDFKVATSGTFTSYAGSATQNIGREETYGRQFYGKIADIKIFATALSAEDILAEYNRKAAIDKNGNLFTGEIIETTGSNTKIDKNSFIDSNLFAATMTLEDGSLWAPICIHYIPDGMFTGANQTFYYTGRKIWENFGAINDLERPESNQWEFYVMQQSIVGGSFSKYRFKQNVSPLSATWDQVNPSKVGTNVTRISATSTNNYAGMYWFNTSNIAMCFANTSNGNWFGCGARTYWGDDYTPGYNGEQVRGWQLVYMRISKHKARMFKNGIMIPTDIIEN